MCYLINRFYLSVFVLFSLLFAWVHSIAAQNSHSTPVSSETTNDPCQADRSFFGIKTEDSDPTTAEETPIDFVKKSGRKISLEEWVDSHNVFVVCPSFATVPLSATVKIGFQAFRNYEGVTCSVRLPGTETYVKDLQAGELDGLGVSSWVESLRGKRNRPEDMPPEELTDREKKILDAKCRPEEWAPGSKTMDTVVIHLKSGNNVRQIELNVVVGC